MLKLNFQRILFVCLLISQQAFAQSFELTLEDLCQTSSNIIRGKVESFNSYQSFDEKRSVYTDIYVKVLETINGDIQDGETIKLTYYGGTINGITTEVSGYPNFIMGEESILFLTDKKKFSSGYKFYQILGDAQGKFNIQIAGKSNDIKIVRDRISAPLRVYRNKEHLNLTSTDAIPLSIFLSEIQEILK